MNKTVVVIAGPTAVGKTALAISIAQWLNASIISADSRQCFKELSIGVAKPSAQELEQVPHYFINTHSVEEIVSAATFEDYALQTCSRLFKQDDVVVMAGGTGLYLKAFLEGMDPIPAIDEAIRHQLTAQYEEKGISWLEEQLKEKDPLFAAQGEMQNPQRMLRSLEVIEATGTSITAFQKGQKKQRDFNVIQIALDMPREELYNRINLRVDEMMKAGLLYEAEHLKHLSHFNALQTVGYRELFDYFNGIYSLDQGIEKIKQNTRHYAKRQLTWFRRDQKNTWFHPNETRQIKNYIEQQLKTAGL